MCKYLYICYWLRVNKDETSIFIEVSSSIRKKSTFRMNISWMDAQQRPNITQIIIQLVNRLSAKFHSEKIKQKNSWRLFS